MKKQKMPLNKVSISYLLRMLEQQEDQKLTVQEEVNLFQDLLDSGLIWSLESEHQDLVCRLVNVGLIYPPKGLKMPPRSQVLFNNDPSTN